MSFREFEALRAQADTTRVPVTKRRRCFLYNDRYFQIDVYQTPLEGLVLLEAYLDYENSGSPTGESQSTFQDLLPSWLKLTEVTNDKAYSMFTLAEKTRLANALETSKMIDKN